MGCPVVLGDHNYIRANRVLGSIAENARDVPASALMKNRGNNNLATTNPRQAGLAISSIVVARGLVPIHAGIERSSRVDDHLYIHSRCHLNHDSVVEVSAVAASGVTTGGRVTLGAFRQTGLESALHQGTHVGAFSMVGMNSTVKGREGPLSLYFGSPGRHEGLNLVRLKRLGPEAVEIAEIERLVRPDSPSHNQARLDVIVANLEAKSMSETLRV